MTTVEVQAAEAVQALTARGLTVATAESLTGGLVSAALSAARGASSALLGGVVVYATEAKATLCDVDPQLLRTRGPVAAETAAAMADGVRARLGADVAVATTGVAGPDSQDGHPPGTVHVAAVGPGRRAVRSFVGDERIPGERDAIREATVIAALTLLASVSSE